MHPHEKLDAALNERRLDLRMEWNEVAAALGISPRSLLDIRRGRSGPRELTARAMDDWLGWAPGSVRQVLAGGDPTPRRETADQIADEVDTRLGELGEILERALEERRGRPLTETQRRVTIEIAGSLERTLEALEDLDQESG